MAKTPQTTERKQRKTVDPNETPRQKLERLMKIRVGNILTSAKNVQNLATYDELTDADVAKVKSAVEPVINEMFDCLEKRRKPETAGGFSL